jgi:hypothetical protein
MIMMADMTPTSPYIFLESVSFIFIVALPWTFFRVDVVFFRDLPGQKFAFCRFLSVAAGNSLAEFVFNNENVSRHARPRRVRKRDSAGSCGQSGTGSTRRRGAGILQS